MSSKAPSSAAAGPASGHLALLGVQLCFGLFPLFGKWAFVGFDPRAVAVWRITGGAVLFTCAALALHGRRVLVARRDLLRLQICALLGVALNQLLYLEGLQRTTSVDAGLLMMLIPVFTFSLAALARHEVLSLRRGAGIAVAFAGAALLFAHQDLDLGAGHLHGNLLLVGNTFAYSIYLVTSRHLAVRYPPLVLMAWVYVLCLWTLPLIGHGAVLLPPGATTPDWLSLGYVLLFPTVLGYLLNMFALERVSASTTASYIFLQPLIAGYAGIAVLGESLRPNTLLASAGIFSGLWLVLRPRRRRLGRAAP